MWLNQANREIMVTNMLQFIDIALANYAFLTPYVLRVLCLFLIVESALGVCRSNSDTPCIIFFHNDRVLYKGLKFCK
jgi:hypothetical protein